MSEKSPDPGAVKQRLLSLYESSSPQLFTQLLVDYDVAAQRLDTEATRVHDLRAAARLQILFADGFKPAAAIQFLQEAIRHIEAYGLPSSDAAVLYPDGSGAPRNLDTPPSHVAEPEPQPIALPVLPPPSAVRQPLAMKAARENRVGRIPALFSALYHSQPLTALNLGIVAGGEGQPVLDH